MFYEIYRASKIGLKSTLFCCFLNERLLNTLFEIRSFMVFHLYGNGQLQKNC